LATSGVQQWLVGEGKSLYVSAEEIRFGKGSSLLKELAARFIGLPPITIKGEKEYHLLMNRKGEDLLLYILNRPTGSLYSPEKPENVRLTIDTSVLGDIRKAELIPSHAPVALTQRAGSVQLDFQASPSVTTVRLIKRCARMHGARL
jgi:hypothetical protein